MLVWINLFINILEIPQNLHRNLEILLRMLEIWNLVQEFSELRAPQFWTNPLSNQDLIIASYLGNLNTKPFQVRITHSIYWIQSRMHAILIKSQVKLGATKILYSLHYYTWCSPDYMVAFLWGVNFFLREYIVINYVDNVNHWRSLS